MHRFFSAVDGERFLRVPEQNGQLDWSAAEVGGPHDAWQAFGVGDEVIPGAERAALAREQAGVAIDAGALPENLQAKPAWPQAPHTIKRKAAV